MEILREILLEMHEIALNVDSISSSNVSSSSNNNNSNNSNNSLYLSTLTSILVLDLDTSSSSSLSSSSLVVSKSLQIVTNKSTSIIATTYIPLAQCFISILSDSSIVLVSDTLSSPQSSSSSSSLISEKIVFPKQPKKVIDLHDKGVAVIDDDDSVFQFKLIDITTKINVKNKNKSSSSSGSSSSSSSSSSSKSIIVGNSNHITIVNTSSKNELTLVSWQPTLLSSLSLSTGIWLSDGATTTTIKLNDNETIIACRSNDYVAHSFFILLSSSSSSAGRLLKVDARGDVLYERALSTNPTDLRVSNDKLWIVSKTGIDVWDGRYGVPNHSFLFNSPSSSASIILPYNSNSYQYICCLSSKTSSSSTSTSIVRHIMTLQGNDDNSLCKAIGKLSNAATTTSIVSINDKKRKGDSMNNSNEKKTKSTQSSAEEGDTDFLGRIDQSKGADIKASEWDRVRALINKKQVSLKTNSNLIEEVARAGRADLLAFIALQIADLTEREAVRILQAYMLIPAAAMKNLRAHKGSMVWIKDEEKIDDKTKNKKKKNEGKGLTELSLLSFLIQPLLQRRSSFAPQLLTDAARHIRPQFAILLLRLFMSFIKGLSASLSLKATQVIELEERQVLRSIDWTEAIMDAHFPAITFSYRQDPSSYHQFLAVAPGADDISLKIEKILGICTHIEKMVDIPANQHIVQKSLYLVESLNI